MAWVLCMQKEKLARQKRRHEKCRYDPLSDLSICSLCAWSYTQEIHIGETGKQACDCYMGASLASMHSQRHGGKCNQAVHLGDVRLVKNFSVYEWACDL